MSIIEKLKTVQDERKELDRRRRQHLEQVIATYIESLRREGLWPTAPNMRPRPSEKGFFQWVPPSAYDAPVDFEALIGATDICLPTFAGFVEFAVLRESRGSVLYRLWQDELGELGTLRIRKLNKPGWSEIRFSESPLAQAISAGDEQSNSRMSESRKRRANMCKELKDAHADWSHAKVAMAATEKLEEEVTVDDVRNDYRAMGWTWERADRIR